MIISYAMSFFLRVSYQHIMCCRLSGLGLLDVVRSFELRRRSMQDTEQSRAGYYFEKEKMLTLILT
jgi:hypothetical protein